VTEGRRIRVTAYSGYKGEESPRSFFIEQVKVDVVSLMETWTEEPLQDRGRRRFFRVRGGDGFTYTLYYDEVRSEWFLAGE